MSGAWLVLPTYNEAENLEAMIRAVLPRLAEAAAEHHVLVVDDGSPDGTGEIADRLAAELARAGRAEQLAGIGKTLAEKIVALV